MECRKEYLCIDEMKHSTIVGNICNIQRMKSSNKQKHMYTYVSPQESYTGRTAKKHVRHQKRKNVHSCVFPEKNKLYMYKAKQ